VDAWISRVLFDEGGNDVVSSIVAVSISEAVVEHAMVNRPDGFA
jgi:hypothetical protein